MLLGVCGSVTTVAMEAAGSKGSPPSGVMFLEAPRERRVAVRGATELNGFWGRGDPCACVP